MTTEHSPSLALETWFEVNKKRVLVGILLVAVAGLGYYLVKAGAEQKRVAAGTALALAELAVDEGPLSPEALSKVAAEFPGTAAASQAKLRAAVAYFEAGKFAEAQQGFEAFLAEAGDSPLKGTAELGVAASLDAQKKLDPAAEAYQRVITGQSGRSLALQAKLGLASVLEQKGQPEKALKLYDEVMGPAPGGAPSAWVSEAMQRRELLLQRQPNLASSATNAPPSAVVPVVK